MSPWSLLVMTRCAPEEDTATSSCRGGGDHAKPRQDPVGEAGTTVHTSPSAECAAPGPPLAEDTATKREPVHTSASQLPPVRGTEGMVQARPSGEWAEVGVPEELGGLPVATSTRNEGDQARAVQETAGPGRMEEVALLHWARSLDLAAREAPEASASASSSTHSTATHEEEGTME